jgi:hypothetical protein
MLIRLMLFLLVVTGVAVLARYVRSKRLDRAGGLDVFEVERLMKLAGDAPRLKEAMVLRVGIVEATPEAERRDMSARVDGVLRRLARQEVLRDRVVKTLAATDKASLELQIAETEAEGKTALAKQLSTQLAQLRELHQREDELDEVNHRLLVELRNLHLALLNASSSEVALESQGVTSALAQLEETSDSVRQKTSADAEVERLLKAAASSQRQRT